MSKDKETERPSWDYTETRYFCDNNARKLKRWYKKQRRRLRRRKKIEE